MQQSNPDLHRPMLRVGSVAFLAGMVIFLVSTILHPGREDPTNHPLVFAEYAEDDLWIASHIGQFAGGMLAFAGGFIALFRLLSRSESGIASALAWMGLAATIAAGSALAVLQAVDGIALKIAVNSWYAVPPSSAEDEQGEKAIAFRVAEGIRWTEIAANSFFRILQGSVGIIFGVAIAASAVLSRWVGAFGIFAGVATIILGVRVAYVGFATVGSIEDTVSTWTYLAWVIILGIFMWRKTTAKKMTTTTR
ncbi:MAG: hypothetical protein M3270_02400 [Thermoproteota archaeon]|nr:hypothetical protein [Thermoproteota archaeon]